jgi:CheY-like chemotaxis protein
MAQAKLSSVLLVEDNPDMRKLARIILEHSGHEVVEAEDGVEAAELLTRRPFDAVVTDVHMPRRSGMEVIDDVHRIQPAARIVAMSGAWLQGDVDYRKAAEEKGVHTCLTKPFPMADLLAVLD